MKILIIGGGMFVTGRGSDSSGTIIPAIVEAIIANMITNVAIATTNYKSAKKSVDLSKEILSKSGINKDIDYYPKSGKNKDSYKVAINEFNPDLAIVCVPDHLHYEVTKHVLLESIHCLVVKPFVLEYEHGKELTDLAIQNNLINRVEFHKRLDESNILMRDEFRLGKLGKPLYFTVEYSQRKSIPQNVFRSWAASSNIVNYLGVHYIDLIYYTTGYTPKSVCTWSQSKFLCSNGINTPDAIQVVIVWEDNFGDTFNSIIAVNWIDPNSSSAMSDQRILLVGTEGRCLADQKNRGVEVVNDSDNGTRIVNPYFTQSYVNNGIVRHSGYGIRSVLSFISEVYTFKNHGLENNSECDSIQASFNDALISTCVLDHVSKSLKNPGKIIRIEL